MAVTGARRQRDWQKTDPHLRRHPAFLRFRTQLGVSDNEAHGILVGLWSFAFDFAQDGDLSRFSHEDVALGIGYLGDPEQLFLSLRQYFLDGDQIRSWEEWGGALFTERTFHAQRRWDQRHAAKSSEQEEVSHDKVRQSATVAPDKRREEKKREDLNSSSTVVDVIRKPRLNHDGFDAFWRQYPKKAGKKDALLRWRRMGEGQRQRATVVAQAVAFAVANGYRELTYVPMGSTFLNSERYEDWYDEEGELVIPGDYAPSGNGKTKQREIDDSIARAINSVEWPEEES